MTVRLLRSLRVSGGRFASAEFIAVKPRLGPGLRSETIRELQSLNGMYLEKREANRFPWNPFYGKSLALLAAERMATADALCFLDSDILITGEPRELALQDGEDFAACPSFDATGSSTGNGGANDLLWEEAGKLIGVNIPDFPIVQASVSHQPIRLNFNSGVVVCRRACGFGKEWVKSFAAILDARITHPVWGIYSMDEVAVAVTVQKLGLRWRPLSVSHNHSISSWSDDDFEPSKLQGAAILHYHAAMEAARWDRFMAGMSAAYPDTHRWLRLLGPITSRGLGARLARSVLRMTRAAWRRYFLWSSRKVGAKLRATEDDATV